jgi:hypothetical protein
VSQHTFLSHNAKCLQFVISIKPVLGNGSPLSTFAAGPAIFLANYCCLFCSIFSAECIGAGTWLQIRRNELQRMKMNFQHHSVHLQGCLFGGFWNLWLVMAVDVVRAAVLQGEASK